jgi:hypothetical protein
MVSSKKKSTVMSPIWRRMKKRNPSSGQNDQLVHWWLLIHSGPLPPLPLTYLLLLPALPLCWHSQLPQFRVYGGSGWSFELQEL